MFTFIMAEVVIFLESKMDRIFIAISSGDQSLHNLWHDHFDFFEDF